MTAVHISLKVRDLDRAVAFYSRFFGEPAKLEDDYAKFVTRNPEIHLALGPGLETDSRKGALSHLGIRVESTVEVERWRADLRERGVIVGEPERSECCYALQDKFWLTDPDGTRWEIYTVLEDVERMAPERAASCCPSEEAESRSSCCAP